MQKMKYGCILVVAMLTAFGMTGCDGSKVTPVSGTVTLDGDPVEGAVVQFYQQGFTSAKGTTDADGNFTLTSVADGDGAPIGMCQVSIVKIKTTPTGEGEEDMGTLGPEKIEYLIPQKYALKENSGIEIEVKKGMEPVKLDLKSNP